MKHSAEHLRAKAAEFRNTAAAERDGLTREVLLTVADGFDEIAKMREKQRFAESRHHLGVQIGVVDRLWEEQSSHEPAVVDKIFLGVLVTAFAVAEAAWIGLLGQVVGWVF